MHNQEQVCYLTPNTQKRSSLQDNHICNLSQGYHKEDLKLTREKRQITLIQSYWTNGRFINRNHEGQTGTAGMVGER